MKKLSCIILTIVFMSSVLTLTANGLMFPGFSDSRAALNQYSFSLYVNTDDDNAMTDPALRDEDLTQTSYANVGFTSLNNAANSLNFRVYKINPVNGSMNVATNSKLITSNSTSQIQLDYNSTYLTAQGWYALYGWTSKNDCSVNGYWAP